MRLLKQTKEEKEQEAAARTGMPLECDAATVASTAIMQNMKSLI